MAAMSLAMVLGLRALDREGRRISARRRSQGGVQVWVSKFLSMMYSSHLVI